MTITAEQLATARLKFFRDLDEADRKVVFSTFGIEDGVLSEVRTHSDELRIFNYLFAAAPTLPSVQEVPDVAAMVNRFLGWPLPKTFGPDCGITFDGRKDDEFNKNKTWPIGTNLFTADEAKAMFEYCIGGAK